jgi:hypothetical protein
MSWPTTCSFSGAGVVRRRRMRVLRVGKPDEWGAVALQRLATILNHEAL